MGKITAMASKSHGLTVEVGTLNRWCLHFFNAREQVECD